MGEGIENALAEVWRRSGPLLEERLTAIELAVDELSEGSREQPSRKAGHEAAHMLAGVLGTFGLDHGTVLARDLEERLDRPRAGSEAAQLNRIAAELRALVDGAAVA